MSTNGYKDRSDKSKDWNKGWDVGYDVGKSDGKSDLWSIVFSMSFIVGLSVFAIMYSIDHTNTLGQAICDDMYGSGITKFDSYDPYNKNVRCKSIPVYPDKFDGIHVGKVETGKSD
jgi:hypothetical protein